MKIVSKLIVASMFALSAAVPALAVEPEAITQEERNTFLYTTDARPIAPHWQNNAVGAQRGHQALAFAPARSAGEAPVQQHDDQY
jgi:hypothetical protein